MNERYDKLAPGNINKLHLVTDFFLAMLGVELALPPGRPLSHLALLCGTAACAWTFAASAMRLYSPFTPRRLLDGLVLRSIGTAVVCAILAFMAWAWPSIDAEKVQLRYFAGFFLLTTAVLRTAVFRPLTRLDSPIQDVLVVGTGALAKRTWEILSARGNDRLSRVVGFVSLGNETQAADAAGLPVLGASDDLLEVLLKTPVSEVYLAARIVDYPKQMQAMVDVCERVGMPFALPLHSLHFERAKLTSNSAARDGYLHYMSTAQKPMQYAFKRMVDIVASAAALLVLSPLLAVVALLIKFTSRGPVMFTQQRVGLHGTTFELLKFRSMVINAEELKAKLDQVNEQSGPVFKMKDDPRITSIGRFIRKYSIDELPQLINILRGDMTIVGPRPALPKEVVQYKAWQRRRLSVRPGLTCYWQVSGRNSIGFEEWMRLDLRYVDNFTFWLDVTLIAQTVPAVLLGKGAS